MNTTDIEHIVVKVENGYYIARDEVVNSSEPFPEHKVSKYVFIDQDSMISWMKDNI